MDAAGCATTDLLPIATTAADPSAAAAPGGISILMDAFAAPAIWDVAWTGLWMGGLAATILAVLVASATRSATMRPATRHALWLAVLASFLTPAIVATVYRPTWFASEPAAAIASEGASDGDGASRGAATRAPSAVDRTGADQRVAATEPVITRRFDDHRGWAGSSIGTSPMQPRPLASAPDAGRSPTPAGRPATTQAASQAEPAETPDCGTPPPAATDELDVPALGLFRGAPLASVLVERPADRSASAPSPTNDLVDLQHSTAVRSGGTAPTGLPATDEAAAPSAERSSADAPIAAPSVARDSFNRWFSRVVAVRDAIAALPPIPWPLWLAGTLTIIAIQTVRIARVRRLVRSAMPASPEIQREVHQVARSMGIERTPITLVSDERISPLVWCGVATRLVLPADLWETLDRQARRAILVHELAHIRRGDHRVLWLETVVSALYWWHPIAWWARARLRDSAETACDTWVTAVCPQSRRSYAEALVLAASFLSSTASRPLRAQHAACASVSVGFVTGRSRRLARRITMVMTSRSAPRMSLVGTAACLLALGMGAFVAPSLACPPSQCEDTATAQAAEKAAKARASTRVRVLTPNASGGPATTLPAHPGVSSPFQGEAPAIDAMGQQPGSFGGAANGRWIAPGEAVILDTIDTADGETVRRTYELPEGKLEALIELMSRQDVPIFIEPGDESLVVIATPRQHEVFGAFVQLIHPEAGAAQPGSAARAPNSRYRALMPNAQGQMKLQQLGQLDATKRELQSLLRERDAYLQSAERQREMAERARERAEEMRDASRELLESRQNMSRLGDAEAERAIAAALQSLEARAKAAESEANSIETRASSAERQMESMERAIERLEERLEALSEKLEELNLSGEVLDSADLAAIESLDLATITDEIEEADGADLAEIEEFVAPAAAPAPASLPSTAPAAAPAPAGAPAAAPAPVAPSSLPPAPAALPTPPAPPVAPSGR